MMLDDLGQTLAVAQADLLWLRNYNETDDEYFARQGMRVRRGFLACVQELPTKGRRRFLRVGYGWDPLPSEALRKAIAELNSTTVKVYHTTLEDLGL